MMIHVLLNALVPIFAITALGYFAGWIRDVDNHHVAELNALVMDFALPASLFAATASTSGTVLSEQWPLLVVLTVSMLTLYALSIGRSAACSVWDRATRRSRRSPLPFRTMQRQGYR
jgi:malonate transporter and related proteins